MDHPYEDLAEYLDGALSDEGVARVHAHLSSCASCTADVEHAAVGRDALRPLEEITPPDGLVARARRQVTGPSSTDEAAPAATPPRGNTTSRYERWASRALAAAAVIGVLFVGGTMLSNQQRSRDVARQTEALLPAESAGTAASEEQTMALQDLATAERDRYASQFSARYAPPAGLHDEGTEIADDFAAQPAASPVDDASKQAAGAVSLGLEEVDNPAAARCLGTSGAGPGELLRIYRGEAAETPSYFGIYVQGPTPKAEPDRVAVWVVSQGKCEVLGYAQAYLIYPSPSPAPEGFDWPSP